MGVRVTLNTLIKEYDGVRDCLSGKFKGFFAWFLWMGIHLMSLVSFRNEIVTFFNWTGGYFRYDRALRIIQYQKPRKRTHERKPLEENV